MFIFDSTDPERDELVGSYRKPQLLFDSPKLVERRLPDLKMPNAAHVQLVRPGILSGRAPLQDEVRTARMGLIGCNDPALKTPVPQPQPMRLTISRNPVSLLSLRIEDVYLFANQDNTKKPRP